MRTLSLLLAAFTLLAFESPLLRTDTAAFAPDLGLAFVLYAGLTSRFASGLALALALGLLKDAFSPAAPVGLYMEVMTLAYLVMWRISQRLALRGPVGVALVTVVFSLGTSVAELVLSLVFDRTFGASGERGTALVLGAMLPHALVTAAFAPPVFWLSERIDRLTTRKSESVYL